MKGSTLCWVGAWGNLCWAGVSLAGMLFGGPHWIPTFVIAMALSGGLAILGRSLLDQEADDAQKKNAAKRKAERETTKTAPSS